MSTRTAPLLEKLARRWSLSAVDGCEGWYTSGNTTPAWSFRSFVKASERLRHLTIRVPTSRPAWPEQAQIGNVLRVFDDLPDPTGMYEVNTLAVPGVAFDAFCTVAPEVGQSLRFELGEDANQVLRGFPVFRCELAVDDEAGALRETLKRGALGVDWGREPYPVIELWIKNPNAGWPSFSKAPWRITFTELSADIRGCFGSAETEWTLRNFRGERLEFRGTVDGARTRAGQTFDRVEALLAFTWSFLVGSANAVLIT